MPFDPTQTYGSTAVTPAGAGQTVGAAQTGNGLTFWDPSKYAMVVDSRPVPGMNVFTGTDGTPQNFLQAFSGGTSGAPSSVTGDPGYAGDPGTPGPPLNRPPIESGTSKGTTLGETMNNLLALGSNADPTAIQTLQDQLIKGGFLDPTKKGFNYGAIAGTADPTYSAWYQLMETAIRTGTDYNAILQARVARDAGKKYEDALAAQQAKIKKQQAAALAATLPHTVNRTTTNISDPLTAQNLMTQTLQNELGRAPTPAELTQFTQALQTAQAANPTTTTAVTDPMSPYQDKSATQTGGFDSGQFTQNYIDQNFSGEKAAVGGATGFYQAALSALGAGGRGY